ncbi:MAG: cache domain-containing protein [Anaerolineae bacterium]|nr:cache domain-containing protein [Anaerolineae bacterium]
MSRLRFWPVLRVLWENSYVRVTLAVMVILAGYLLLVTYFVNSYTARLDEVRQAELRRIAQIGVGAIAPYRYSAAPHDSIFSATEARQQGAAIVRELTDRYELGENYLFMITFDGVSLVQPFERQREFTSQWDLQDANGRYFVRELIAAARSPQGAGYVEYLYPPPGSDTPQRKISYVVGIPEWNCLIGTGMYMDDIDAENRAYLRNSLVLTLGLFALIVGAVVVSLRPMMSGYRALLGLFERVGEQPDAPPPVPVERFHAGSESWKLLAGFQDMLAQIERHKQAVRDEQEHRHEAEQAAAQAERNRLARELHDAVTQTLFAASLIADVLPRLWERNPAEGHRRLEELRQLTRGALAEMRTLLLELRPASLVEAELGALLTQLAEAFTARARVPVALTVESVAPLPAEVRIALYRIAQEALNNIARHADATQVRVQLSGDERRAELTVADDGRGFDLATVSSDHLGLGIMRERAEALGATLVVASQVGSGTVVSVRWARAKEAQGHG